VNKILIATQLNNVGKNFQCDQNVIVYDGHNINIGNNVVLNRGVLLQSCEGARISIGNNVTFSYGVKIITGNLSKDSLYKTDFHSHTSSSIQIGNNVWIGANSIILPGVQIPNNTIIAAGTIVNKALPDENCLYAGVPVKKIKNL